MGVNPSHILTYGVWMSRDGFLLPIWKICLNWESTPNRGDNELPDIKGKEIDSINS